MCPTDGSPLDGKIICSCTPLPKGKSDSKFFHLVVYSLCCGFTAQSIHLVHVERSPFM